jgi:hypothetical protein
MWETAQWLMPAHFFFLAKKALFRVHAQTRLVSHTNHCRK